MNDHEHSVKPKNSASASDAKLTADCANAQHLTDPEADPLTIARALDARELCVIPVPRPRPGAAPNTPGDGKVPALAWREYQSRRPTERELVEWFGGEPMNLAIVTGAVSQIVCIDADSPEALRWCTRTLPYTSWQTQTSRGFHLFYRYPGVRVGNRAKLETRDGRLDVDVRGDGGFVVAPGSVHASGARYRTAGDWTTPREDVPRFWPGWLQRPVRPSVSRPCDPSLPRARALRSARCPPRSARSASP